MNSEQREHYHSSISELSDRINSLNAVVMSSALSDSTREFWREEIDLLQRRLVYFEKMLFGDTER